MKFESEDWALFRTIEGLQQRAGVTKDKLSRLTLKELTDNGLDNGANVNVGSLPKGGYFVEDDGSGIDGTPEDIARLFSIAMAEHAVGKLVPPEEVVAEELEERLEAKARAAVTERILREARLEEQVAKALRKIKRPIGGTLIKGIRDLFKREPQREWRAHIEAVAVRTIRKLK